MYLLHDCNNYGLSFSTSMKTALSLYQRVRAKVQSLSMVLRFERIGKVTGRPLALPIDEIVTIGVFWKEAQIQTKKKLWELLELVTHCSYKTLVVNLNRFAWLAGLAITLLLTRNRRTAHLIKHTDSTAIPVCLLKNEKRHKTMAGIATKDYDGNHYYFGLKLHLTSDLRRSILALRFTTATHDERTVFTEMNEDLTGIFVADAGYVSADLERSFFKEGIRRVLIAARKNMKKLATALDIALYNTRMLIELNFRSLKMFHGLLTSLPRSVNGYLTNYVYSILSYLIV